MYPCPKRQKKFEKVSAKFTEASEELEELKKGSFLSKERALYYKQLLLVKRLEKELGKVLLP